MKLITAIIKPHKLDSVREALAEKGVVGMTVTEVKGYGRQKGHAELYRGAEYQIHFVPKVQLQIGVDDSVCDDIVDLIQTTACSNAIGDGKIFVSPIEQVVRIRTGETGETAL